MQELSIDELMDRWAPDWVYETDLLLVHKSGFAVSFPGDVLRETACGDIVPGSAAGYLQHIEKLATETNHAELLRYRPLQQATIIYRNSPAGTIGAPKRTEPDSERS